MCGLEIRAFPPGVADKLKTYVYRLIDPRNGETFYIGRGRGDRVFFHIRGDELEESDKPDNSLQRIRDIRAAGFEPAHVIHRHGMDEKTAREVEGALIDAYPGLSNMIGGAGQEFGAMEAKEIVSRYCAEPAVFRHKVMLISINRSAIAASSLYEATRYAWRVNKSQADKAEFVLATRQSEIIGAFVPHRWLEATADNFPGRDPAPGRFGFVGEEAPEDIKRLYIGRRVPDEYRKFGAANPIKYTWKSAPNAAAEPRVWQRERPSARRFTEHQLAYHEFFASLVNELRANVRDMRCSDNVGYRSWFAVSAGRSGFRYSFAFAQGTRFRVELYIDTGDLVLNKRAFDQLQGQAREISEELAQPVEWERINHKRASRVSVYKENCLIADSPEALARLRRWAVQTGMKFREVMTPRVRQLNL